MGDSAEDGTASHRALTEIGGAWHRAVLLETLVWAPLVVLRDKRREHAVPMALVQDEQVVQACSAGGAYPALRHRIGTRRPVWRSHEFHSCTLEDRGEAGRELPIPVMDEVAAGDGPVLDLPTQVACLLRDPRCGRVQGAAGKWTLRVRNSMKNSTWMDLRKCVSTVRKSQATIWCR